MNEQDNAPMAETAGLSKARLDPATADPSSADALRIADSARSGGLDARPASPPAVSLMITNRQRAELRERGVPDETIRVMTPAEAHARLGLTGPDV